MAASCFVAAVSVCWAAGVEGRVRVKQRTSRGRGRQLTAPWNKVAAASIAKARPFRPAGSRYACTHSPSPPALTPAWPGVGRPPKCRAQEGRLARAGMPSRPGAGRQSTSGDRVGRFQSQLLLRATRIFSSSRTQSYFLQKRAHSNRFAHTHAHYNRHVVNSSGGSQPANGAAAAAAAAGRGFPSIITHGCGNGWRRISSSRGRGRRRGLAARGRRAAARERRRVQFPALGALRSGAWVRCVCVCVWLCVASCCGCAVCESWQAASSSSDRVTYGLLAAVTPDLTPDR